jgi:hypothetical protein
MLAFNVGGGPKILDVMTQTLSNTMLTTCCCRCCCCGPVGERMSESRR